MALGQSGTVSISHTEYVQNQGENLIKLLLSQGMIVAYPRMPETSPENVGLIRPTINKKTAVLTAVLTKR